MINLKKAIITKAMTSERPTRDCQCKMKQRPDYFPGKIPVVPTYNYQIIGVENGDETAYKNWIQMSQGQIRNLHCGYRVFYNKVPFNPQRPVKLMQKTEDLWASLTDLSPLGVKRFGNQLLERDLLPRYQNPFVRDSVEVALLKGLVDFVTYETNSSMTTFKNFALKFLSYVIENIPELIREFDPKVGDRHNPKALYIGDIKKHEVYFLTFLSEIGCDVIYITPTESKNMSSHPIAMRKFKKLDYGHYKNIPLQEPQNQANGKQPNPSQGRVQHQQPQQRQQPPQQQQFQQNRSIPNRANQTPRPSVPPTPRPTTSAGVPRTGINQRQQSMPRVAPVDMTRLPSLHLDTYLRTSLKDSQNLLEDVKEPLQGRRGFLSQPVPLIPVYCYRYLGTLEDQDLYKNNLYRLDKKLTALDCGYLKFEERIPLAHNQELIMKMEPLWSMAPHYRSEEDILNLLKGMKKLKIFTWLKEEFFEDTLIRILYELLNTGLTSQGGYSVSQMKNLVVKLVIWLDQFIPKLYPKGYKDLLGGKCNPKILYFGGLKGHEALLLIILSRLGTDVLYVNPQGDDLLGQLDQEGKYSKLIQLEHQGEQMEFPKTEVLTRRRTTAFEASREIEHIIHNETDGVYKPWQFESYFVQPRTLCTTKEELMILWNEDARMRHDFKIENKTVYVPNLFAKISGVPQDLNEYWREMKRMEMAKHKMMFVGLPFTKQVFTQRDYLSMRYLVSPEGALDIKELKKSSHYRFSFLKSALQDMIIKKIQQLFETTVLSMNLDREQRVKILKVIMDIDEKLLNLIQQYDYPFAIPKIIIYDNNREVFSEEDSIILAFLNLMAFDIVIFTPTGYNNIEDKIDPRYYDIHKLEGINFNLPMEDLSRVSLESNKSFWSGLFRGNS